MLAPRHPATSASPLTVSPPAVFLVTLAVYLLAAVRMLPYVEPPTGDQPHYLLQTISMAEDGDLDLKNNYTTAESYRAFSAPGRRREGFYGIPVSYPVQPEGHIVVRASETGELWYPKHSPGLPFLLLPGWLIGQALAPLLDSLTNAGGGGWAGAVIQMSVVGALLASQTFLLAWDVTGRRRLAFVVWAAVSFSVPQMLVSLMIYPEALAALGLVYAFRHLVVCPLPSSRWRLLLVGLVIAALPWLNPRFVLVSGMLALLALVVVWRNARQRAAAPVSPTSGGGGGWVMSLGLLLGPLAVSAAGLRWFQVQIHGSSLAVADQYEGFFVPTMIDGQLGADWQALFVALAGLFVDRQYGVLVFAPVYALALVGVVALWRSREWRLAVVGLVAVIVPYVLLTADFRVWWGGWSPPARYLAVLTPLLAAPLAYSLLALSDVRAYRVVFGALAGVGVLAVTLLLLQLGDPDIEQAIFSNPARNPAMLRWLMLRYGVDLSPFLPATAAWFGGRRDPVSWPQIVGYLGLLGTLVTLAILALPRGPRAPRGSAVATLRPGSALAPAYAEAVTVPEPPLRPPAGPPDTRR